jgi:hypothetical protein
MLTRHSALTHAAASTIAHYKSTAGNTYTIYHKFVTQSTAHRACNDAGGHLAAYNSRAEQIEVEVSAYVSMSPWPGQ